MPPGTEPVTRTADVVIIGAGIQGCSAALYCRQRGLSVIVVEKDRAGRHASGVNAGGVRRLCRDFAEIPLAVASMRIWHHIEDLLGDDCGFHASGQIRIAETPDDLETLQTRARQVRDLGYTHEQMIGRDELYEIVPALAPHCLGALTVRDDGFADPARTTGAFRKRAADLGAVFLEDCRAQPPERRSHAWAVPTSAGILQSASVINCAGAWGGQIAAALGEPVPIAPTAPMLMITERLAPFITPVLSAVNRYLSFKQLANGTVLIGGGRRGHADPERNTARVDLGGLAILAATARELFPVMSQARAVLGRDRGADARRYPGDRTQFDATRHFSRLRLFVSWISARAGDRPDHGRTHHRGEQLPAHCTFFDRALCRSGRSKLGSLIDW